MNNEEFVSQLLDIVDSILKNMESNPDSEALNDSLLELLESVKDEPTPANAEVLMEVLTAMKDVHMQEAVNSLTELKMSLE